MPLSTINSNSFSSTANTNIDGGTLFIDAINNRIGMATITPTEALDVRANATFGSASGVNASVHIQSGYDSGIKYVSRLTTDFNGVFTVSTGSTATANTPSLAVLTERMRITDTNLFQFNSGYGSVATAFGCRAWVNFNGTGTVVIRASGNVSSITDNGVGNYNVNFTTAMPDANYSSSFSAPSPAYIGVADYGAARTISTQRFLFIDVAGVPGDISQANIAVFR
jgi:hypothetical protein